MHHSSLAAAAVAMLCALPMASAGMYTKSSPVLQVTGKDYERLIAKSNHTTILEFYAPWCGHCQNLKPAYEKAAKNLAGLAKVAAVDCDDDANKPFCGSMGIQGFPTLKIVRPGTKKGSRPIVEDYQGARTAKGIVDAVVDKINNHVKRVADKDLDAFLDKANDTAKAILFTEKGTTSALIKSIAIDFLGVISVAQVRSKEEKAVELFGVTSFPTLVLLPGGDKDGVVYDGEMKKEAIVAFLSQAGSPNPDATGAAPKADTKKPKPPKEKKPASSSSSKTSSAAEESATPSADDGAKAAESDPTKAAPVIIDVAPPIPALNSPEKLAKECLSAKSGTCVLAFVPATPSADDDKSAAALESLAQVVHRHAKAASGRALFPFFAVPSDNAGAAGALEALGLAATTGTVEIVAVNARRGWWRRYAGDGYGREALETWIDAVKMGDGKKEKLPESLVAPAAEEKVEEKVVVEPPVEPAPEETKAKVEEHDEL